MSEVSTTVADIQPPFPCWLCCFGFLLCEYQRRRETRFIPDVFLFKGRPSRCSQARWSKTLPADWVRYKIIYNLDCCQNKLSQSEISATSICDSIHLSLQNTGIIITLIVLKLYIFITISTDDVMCCYSVFWPGTSLRLRNFSFSVLFQEIVHRFFFFFFFKFPKLSITYAGAYFLPTGVSAYVCYCCCCCCRELVLCLPHHPPAGLTDA